MTNTRHKFYVYNGNASKITFEISAKRFIEDYTQIKKQKYFLFSRFNSNKVTEFQHGILYLKDSNLSFKQAFWSQGKLILTEVSGIINQQRFNAAQVSFNKRSMQVMSKKITLISENRISRKLNFRQQVGALH